MTDTITILSWVLLVICLPYISGACVPTNMQGSGIFQSPNYPSNYGDNHDLCWALEATDGQMVQIECSGVCFGSADYLYVLDGSSSTDQRMTSMSGCANTQRTVLTSSGGHMYVGFRADGSGDDSGFECHFRSVDTPCLTVTDSSLITPLYAGIHYTDNDDFCWHLNPTYGHHAQLTCSEFCTEADHDILTIDSTDFSGCTVPSSVTSPGPMTVTWTSDHAYTETGFVCAFTSVTIDFCEAATPDCGNGVCANDGDTYRCTCEDGWQGVVCDENIVYCDDDTCGVNGVCVEGVTSYTCTCNDGWTGADCGLVEGLIGGTFEEGWIAGMLGGGFNSREISTRTKRAVSNIDDYIRQFNIL